MMARKTKEIILTLSQKLQLEKNVRSHTSGRQMIDRSQIILSCGMGKKNQQIADEFNIPLARVCRWRNRFYENGIEGLEDRIKPGKPVKYGQLFRDKLLSKLEEPPPEGSLRWDCVTLAKELGSSTHAIWRALKKEGLYLQRKR